MYVNQTVNDMRKPSHDKMEIFLATRWKKNFILAVSEIACFKNNQSVRTHVLANYHKISNRRLHLKCIRLPGLTLNV